MFSSLTIPFIETFKIPTVEIDDEDTNKLISKGDVAAYCSVDEKGKIANGFIFYLFQLLWNQLN